MTRDSRYDILFEPVKIGPLTCPSQKLYLGADHADLVPSRGRGRADSMAG
jgi:hypothetical protein